MCAEETPLIPTLLQVNFYHKIELDKAFNFTQFDLRIVLRNNKTSATIPIEMLRLKLKV